MNYNIYSFIHISKTRSIGTISFAGLVMVLLMTGTAFATTITFDKLLDVPDKDFTVTYEGSTFSFTIDDVGNYKIGDNIGLSVSGGVNNMRLVVFSVDKLTPWFKTFYNSSGSTSATIPANKFDPNCPDVCDDGNGGFLMGPGIYALAIQNRDTSSYFIAKPFIVSVYDMTVDSSRQGVPGSTIKVKVNVSKNGVPFDVGNNTIKVEFLQGTSTYFDGFVQSTSTGVYEGDIQIPTTASGNYQLYAAITTNKNIYQDYPEIIGAASYSGTVLITKSTPTPTPTPNIQLKTGWNMISIPLNISNSTVSAIFGNNVTIVYEWTGTSYVLLENSSVLEPKKGYWALSRSTYNVTLTGTYIENKNVTLSKGWNMVGPVSDVIQVNSLTNVTTVYGWTGTLYELITGSNTLTISKGYWMLANAVTTLQV